MADIKALVDQEKDVSEKESEIVDDQEEIGENKPKRLKKYKEVLGERIEAKKQRREERERRERLGINNVDKKRHRIGNEFFDQKAEMGSDNEENDHVVKNGKDSEDSQDEDFNEMNKNLDEIIDYDPVEDGDEEGALAQFMKDLDEMEKQKLKQVISGDYTKRAQMEEILMANN